MDLSLDPLGPAGEYRPRRREVVRDPVGRPVADVGVAPPLFVARAVLAQRAAPPLPAVLRADALRAAARVFADEEVAGLDFATYTALASRVSGLPVAVVRTGARAVAEGLATALETVGAARPRGAVAHWRDSAAAGDWRGGASNDSAPNGGGAVWVRRGETLAVLASGNGPGVHGEWPQALALGYRVAVRPSRREPFTGHRLVHALRRAGFGPADATYLPTDHAGAAELARAADLALVYGGQDTVDRHAGDPAVKVNGPGRAKVLITADQDWRAHLDVVADSVAHLGGTACVNATAVLYEGDPAPLARALAERLAAIGPLPADHEDAVLPTMPLDQARAVAAHLAARAAGTTPLLGADQVVADLGGGQAALRPAVHLLDRPDPAVLGAELPFPCVWVAPWSRADGLAPLRGSLVVTAVTGDGALVDGLLAEPTIANVYFGGQPTHLSRPTIPHDGFLADFLMRTKGTVRT